MDEHNPVEGEHPLPLIHGIHGSVDLCDLATREDLNEVLDEVTGEPSLDPRLAYDRVKEVLSGAGYILPEIVLESDGDEEVFELMNHEGSQACCYLYFAYTYSDGVEAGETWAELVTYTELDQLLSNHEL
jgi:hypothetical protein